MNLKKKYIKLIIGIIIGMSIASVITVHAYSYVASGIKYTDDMSVEEALNELYANKKETSDETQTITENGEQKLDKYYKNLNVSIEPELSDFTGDFYLSGDTLANYSKKSYFDINVNNYNKITFNITGLYTSKISVFTAYVLADGTNVKNITQIGKFEIDTSSVSTIRLYYQENEGYYYISGTYTLSN